MMSAGCFSYVYDNTAEGSELRQFIVDMCAWNRESANELQIEDHLPREMLLDMVYSFRIAVPERVAERKFYTVDTTSYKVE